MTLRHVITRAAAVGIFCLATVAQMVEAIAPTALIGRVLTGAIAGGIAGDLMLAKAWAGAAQDGQNFGGALLGQGAAGIMQQGSAAGTSSFVQGIGGYSANTMAGAQNSASVANPTLKATGIATFSCAQQAALGIQGSACPPLSPGQGATCQDPNQPSALSALQGPTTTALTQAYSVCQPVGQAINAGAAAWMAMLQNTQPANVSLEQIAANLAKAGQALYNQVQVARSDVNAVVSSYQSVPGCNGLQASDVNNMATAITTAANALSNACASLSTSVTASTASALLSQLIGINSTFDAGANGNPTRVVLSNMRSLSALMASTNNGQLSINNLMGPYAGAASSKTLSANTGNPIVNQLMDPSNAGIVGVMTGLLQSTDPSALVPSGNGLFDTCTSSSTAIQTTLGPAGQVSYSAVSDPIAPQTPKSDVCVSAAAPPAAGFAKWIYLPATPGLCNGVAASNAQLTYSFQVPYTAGAGQLNLYVQAYTTAPSASVVIQPRGGANVSFSVSPGAPAVGVPGSPNPPNVTVPVTTASQAAMMTVNVSLSGAGQFWMSVDNNGQNFLGTSSQWFSLSAGMAAAQNNAGYQPSGNSGSAQIQTPSAAQNSVSCKAAIQCLGTQCHSILGTQDKSFSKAAMGLGTLQDIAQHSCCAEGTSMGAGNCQLEVFCGKANTCRNFLLSGAGITNNCCDNPVPFSPWATMLKIFAISYAQGWVPSFSGATMSSLPSWMGSAYKNMSGWYDETKGYITSAADKVWSTVTGPFKSVAQSWSNAWGAGGPTSFAQVMGSMVNLTGTGTTPTTGGSTNAGGASYTVTTGQASTSGVNMTGAGGGMASAMNGVGAAAQLLGGGLQSIANNVIEQIAPKFAASIENALFGSATSTAVSESGNTVVSAGGTPATAAGSGLVGAVMMAYAVYQIACLIGHLITRCTNEEFTFYSNRHQRLCFDVGNYCSNESFFGICLERTYVACCYPSMLDRIIMQQLLILDPGIVSPATATQPYGTPQNPACGGLTPQSLAQASQGGYFDKINLSEYIAYLIGNNMLPTTNSQGSTYMTPEQNNNTGLVDAKGRPTTNQAIFTGQ